MMTRRYPKSDAEAAKTRAEAVFRRKEDQAREGKVSLADYEAERKATLDKTARLRAQRLLKDEAESGKAKR